MRGNGISTGRSKKDGSRTPRELHFWPHQKPCAANPSCVDSPAYCASSADLDSNRIKAHAREVHLITREFARYFTSADSAEVDDSGSLRGSSRRASDLPTV